MLYLMLDTNIWIYIAKGEHPNVIDQILEGVKKNELSVLSNEVITKEWQRNKESVLHDSHKKIEARFNNLVSAAKSIQEFLTDDEKKSFGSLIDSFKKDKTKEYEKANKLVEQVNELILRKSVQTRITVEMKLAVINRGLEKKAPFIHKNNSIGDALILMSTINYLKDKQLGYNVVNLVFISNNTDDYCNAKRGEGSNEFNNDLNDLIGGINVQFSRNIAEALKFAPKLIEEINEFWAWAHQQYYVNHESEDDMTYDDY